jgi:hypothetical protein
MAKKQPTKPDFTSLLSKEVAEKFEIRLNYPRLISKFVIGNYGTIDLKTLSLAQAERLVNLGAKFIAPKSNAKPSEHTD